MCVCAFEDDMCWEEIMCVDVNMCCDAMFGGVNMCCELMWGGVNMCCDAMCGAGSACVGDEAMLKGMWEAGRSRGALWRVTECGR